MLSGRHTPYTPIRNVQRVRRRLSDGRINYHHYHRPTRTKLPGRPGSPEFMAVYWDCERISALARAAPLNQPIECDQPQPPDAPVRVLECRAAVWFAEYGWR
jgi:hypothetical protein